MINSLKLRLPSNPKLSYFRGSLHIYQNFLSSVTDLLPDFSQIKNEVWLLILFFIYQVANGFDVKYSTNAIQETTIAYLPELLPRKRRYIVRKFRSLRRVYEPVIDSISGSDNEFRILVLSILIFENFNRPYVVRIVENLWFRTFGKSKIGTTGIMQTKSTTVLSDIESVRLGAIELYGAYQSFKAQETTQDYGRNSMRRTIKRHCKDKTYIRQILFICKAILDNELSVEEKDAKYKFLMVEIKEEFSLYDSY